MEAVVYSYDEAYQSSLEYFGGDSSAAHVWVDKYALRDSSGNLSWFDLGLFGHTHGGQMKFFSGLLGIAEDVPDRYLSGWFTENRVDLLVSRGIGTSVFPARLLCPPQIHLIEVTVY